MPAEAKGNPEGYLFPATYPVTSRSTPGTVLSYMVRTARRNLATRAVAEGGKTHGMTPYQTATLAGIVQAEAESRADMGKVARVVHNRLARSMPLQMDSTLNYALNRRTVDTKLSDTRIDSPFNTYERQGLPPTPIDSPGLEAMAAAVAPTPSREMRGGGPGPASTIGGLPMRGTGGRAVKWLWKTKAKAKAKNGTPDAGPPQAQPPDGQGAGGQEPDSQGTDTTTPATEAERAAARAELEARGRLIARWGGDAPAWREWLARSPIGVDLLVWWFDEADLTHLVGPERYTERLGELLSLAAPRDVAALRLGCNRRVDRACATPEVCSLDPLPVPDGETPRHRGWEPGACTSFIDLWTPHEIRVEFTPDDRHNATLLLRGGPGDALLWVDGVPVARGEWLDDGGHWQDGRYFVLRLGGPFDHPSQGHSEIGQYLYDIVSLLVYDAELRRAHVFVPADDEPWKEPVVDVRDGTGYVYADKAARDAGVTAREFALQPPGTG
ncbi:endolytic transglycosylase MltG [Streptomyces sp. NPDC057010]|uniref:endolytic transglycosylase MltG n=1 Tax=Streptomyces sp. NPDC057010 TaxID=3345997 RepID=UPI003633EB34